MKINNNGYVWGERLIYWAFCILTLGLLCVLRITISEAIRCSFDKDLK